MSFTAMISVENLTKHYPLERTKTPALRGVDLSIERGERIGLMGPSGSGKSTLLNLIGLIDTPNSGRITIQGTDVSTMNDGQKCEFRNRTMGFVFQNFNLIPVLSVRENVEYPLLLQKIDPRIRRDRVELWLERVGLENYADRTPEHLSGGQRQRVAIARALVTNPGLLIADEPTAALDHKTGHSIMQLMVDMNVLSNSTLVFSTHDPDMARYADSIVTMVDGKIADRKRV